MKIKMEPEEAYSLIELCLNYDKHMSECPERYEMTLQIAREAFHKQTPVKPTARFYPDGSVESTCPNCQESVEEELFIYCPNCGQAIDWED